MANWQHDWREFQFQLIQTMCTNDIFTPGGLILKRMWMILIVAALGCSKAQLPVVPETNTTLEVKAISQQGENIDSVNVFLDGNLVGITPYKNETVQPGLHSLRLMKSGYQTFTKQLTIVEDQFYNVEAVLIPLPPDEGQLVITVNVDSALVTVQDSFDNIVVQTRQRASTHTLRPGGYIVTAEKPGLQEITKAVDVIGGQATTVHLEFDVPAGPPPSLDFAVLEDTVQLGDAITLRWQSNGYQVILDQGIGVRGPNGSEKLVCPSPGLKIFTATAYGENNLTTEKRDSVFIAPRSMTPPTLNFSADPDSLVFGDPVMIAWQSDGYQVVIDQGVGSRGPIGSEEIHFHNPGKKVFTATAYGEENTMTIKQDSVFIKEAPMPELPIVMLSTTPQVQVNEPATISWVAQNADYVVVDYV
ncbi:MAG: PEGA domain-containing protein, partial [Phycisphaerae bacterium]|nr:PEGA domain-containing protein [Phycisphaerae bacterium]